MFWLRYVRLRAYQIVSFVHIFSVREQLAGAHLPECPLSSGRSPHCPVRRGQSLVVSEDHVSLLLLWNVVSVWGEFVREDMAGSILVEEQQLGTTAHEDASQNQCPHSEILITTQCLSLMIMNMFN